MENASRMIIISTCFVLLLAALWNSVELNREKTEMADAADHYIYELDPDLLERPEIEEEYAVPGEVIVQSLRSINESNYKINIHYPSEVLSFTPGLDIEQVNVAKIDISKKYKPTYKRENNGQIQQIDYFIKLE